MTAAIASVNQPCGICQPAWELHQTDGQKAEGAND